MNIEQMKSGALPTGCADGDANRRGTDLVRPAGKSKSKIASLAVLDALRPEEWGRIRACLQEAEGGRPGMSRGRPRTDARAVLGGVLYVLVTGCPWPQMPADYPPYQTCHRRFKRWRDAGVLEQALAMLYRGMHHHLLAEIRQRKKVRRPRSETSVAVSPPAAPEYV
ncbi:transposase [Burkholderia ubonensis]|uniref:transposase n=1 Tax=Burkholderia ubonensis TaxID=101571 RepID=UPI00075A09AF